ncbi:MAG: phosphate/phosphite/phosphonate ABC transporter substrate-binding protein [Silvanigrellales bacterium]|jgi:phosphonate transport system substrate-binding protein|nr:phosphate/phosphite/phosphonate ABC transporter substrate-binding protein [Silvanigrellales bacterium]
MQFSKTLVASLVLVSGVAYAQDEKTLGSRKNPIKLSMVPSSDATKILSSMKPVAQCLEKETGLFFDISVPNNYVVVVEGLGSKKVDVAFVPTFGYLLAKDRYGAEAFLKASRHGETTYKGAIVARNDDKLKTVKDLNGKKIAYVDPASTSGYILPKKLFLEQGVKPSEEVFGGKHDVVVTMIYQGQVDAGAVYYNAPAADGKIRDARERVLTQFPDVEKKVKILALTEEIPNDPIVIRKDVRAEVKAKVQAAFQACVTTNVESFKGINNSDALAPVKDADYDGLRKTIKDLNIDLSAELNKKK